MFVRDSVDLHNLLLWEYRSASIDGPYDVSRFPGEVFKNLVPPSFASFVQAEVQALVDRGCVVKWANVLDPGGAPRPCLVMTLSVEETKPCLIYDVSSLNKGCREVLFSMDTVARVANVTSRA